MLRFSFVFIVITALLISTEVAATPVHPHPHPHQHPNNDGSEDARKRLLATLPASIRDDLNRRDPSEYTLYPDFHTDNGDSVQIDQKCVDGQTAMTYDDGVWQYEKNLTNVWLKAQQEITYYVNVNNYDCSYNSPYPEYLQYALQNGMEVGSHTATHPDLTTLTMEQIDKQVRLVEEFLWKVAGVVPATIRPPYFSTNATINAYLSSMGYRIVEAAVDTKDFNEDVAFSVGVIDSINKGDGDIVLNHEVHEPSVSKIAPKAVQIFQQKNIQSVGIGKCLNISPYKVRLHTMPKRDSSWNCDGIPAPGKP